MGAHQMTTNPGSRKSGCGPAWARWLGVRPNDLGLLLQTVNLAQVETQNGRVPGNAASPPRVHETKGSGGEVGSTCKSWSLDGSLARPMISQQMATGAWRLRRLGRKCCCDQLGCAQDEDATPAIRTTLRLLCFIRKPGSVGHKALTKPWKLLGSWWETGWESPVWFASDRGWRHDRRRSQETQAYGKHMLFHAAEEEKEKSANALRSWWSI